MPLAEYLEGPKSAPPVTKAAPSADSEVEIRKKVFLQFGAMVALGLALAGWYVGYRIFAAREARPLAPVPILKAVVPTTVPESKPIPVITPQPTPPPVESKPTELPAPIAPVAPIAKPVAIKIETPTQQPATVHQQPVTKRKDSAAVQPFTRHDAKPRSGERYLQIAAFGPRALDGFLKTLEGQGLHPVVAPGPVDSIYRILVGPFPNSAALEETRSLIKASGIEPILRTY